MPFRPSREPRRLPAGATRIRPRPGSSDSTTNALALSLLDSTYDTSPSYDSSPSSYDSGSSSYDSGSGGGGGCD